MVEDLRAAAPPTSDAGTGSVPPAGGLGELQDRLEHVDQVALEERPALLERANAALVEALGDLEEV